MNKRAIGLLGGTYDPIHNGHLAIAKHVQQELNLQNVTFIPNNNPANRAQPIASANDRFAMVKLATEHNSKFAVNNCELRRKGKSYTIDTLQELSQLHPDQPLCWIIGMDQLIKLNQWDEWHSLFDYAHFVVINRPGYDLPTDQEWLNDLLQQRQTQQQDLLHNTQAGSIYLLDIEPNFISANNIRSHINDKKLIQSQLPAAVINYIDRQQLYLL